MTGKYIDWAEIEREQMLDREAAVVANLNKKLGISEPKPEPEPNALQDENDRLKTDVAMLEGQVRDSVRKDALIKELREALTVACDWNWDAHYLEVANHFYDSEQVPAPICKQIFEALHRKV